MQSKKQKKRTWEFPRSGSKAKNREEREKERLNNGDNNGQATHGAPSRLGQKLVITMASYALQQSWEKCWGVPQAEYDKPEHSWGFPYREPYLGLTAIVQVSHKCVGNKVLLFYPVSTILLLSIHICYMKKYLIAVHLQLNVLSIWWYAVFRALIVPRKSGFSKVLMAFLYNVCTIQ